MRWEKTLATTATQKPYLGNNIIKISFSRSTRPNSSWVLIVNAWNIPSYTFKIYERFNEKKFLETAGKIIITHNAAKHCVFNRIFNTPSSNL